MKNISIERQDIIFEIAEKNAILSNCNRLKVGAAIISENFIVSTGYNHSPNGLPAENEDGSASNPWVIHAEVHAIFNTSKSRFNNLNKCVLFVTHSPCVDCARIIFQSGIKHVVYKHEYRLKDGIELLEKLGVNVYKSNNEVITLK